MKRKILLFAAYAIVFAIIGFVLDQLIMYITVSGTFSPPLWTVATFFSGIIPGLFLAIAVSLAFKQTHKRLASKRYYMFILIAAIGTLLDYLLQLSWFNSNLMAAELGRLIAILVSTCIFVFAFHKYLLHLSQKQIVSLSLLGSTAAYLPFLIIVSFDPLLPLLFLLYPITMSSALGWIAHNKK
jgi:hypothetical protein